MVVGLPRQQVCIVIYSSRTTCRTFNIREIAIQMGTLLIIACFLHCGAGFILGYWTCRILGMDKLTSRTISLEVGLQNSGMASGIAAELKKVATLGLAPIVFGPVMNITASTIANWWRTHTVELTDGLSDLANRPTETTTSEDIKA